MDERKKYYYFIHPDLHYFKRFKSPYTQDVSSIYQNLHSGVLMSGDFNNYGQLYSGDAFESEKDKILHYLDRKYANLKLYHGSRRFSEESVPLYVMKFPFQYLGGDFERNGEYFPMPMFDRFESTCNNKYCDNMDLPSFANEFRVNPELNYGIYSKDLGGFVENPNWTPVPEFLGYTFNKYALPYLIKNGEKDIAMLHYSEFKSREDIAKFERDLGNEIYLNHKLGNLIDMYMDIYGKDISSERHELTEKEILDKFNMNWDITTGLTPGDYKKDGRML